VRAHGLPGERVEARTPCVFSPAALPLSIFFQAFLMRKLKIGGSMALALKMQPILDAAAPRAKL